jgi:hypothetical protein
MVETMTTRETVSLIGSDKVDGTSVYGADDKKIGTVQRVMIDKVSGKVAYGSSQTGDQIINACSRHDEYTWFFRPRLADCCAILSFDRLHL